MGGALLLAVGLFGVASIWLRPGALADTPTRSPPAVRPVLGAEPVAAADGGHAQRLEVDAADVAVQPESRPSYVGFGVNEKAVARLVKNTNAHVVVCRVAAIRRKPGWKSEGSYDKVTLVALEDSAAGGVTAGDELLCYLKPEDNLDRFGTLTAVGTLRVGEVREVLLECRLWMYWFILAVGGERSQDDDRHAGRRPATFDQALRDFVRGAGRSLRRVGDRVEMRVRGDVEDAVGRDR
ncbi:MAG: hypothetical protein AAF628_02065 [Planctomycetota bacterium]